MTSRLALMMALMLCLTTLALAAHHETQPDQQQHVACPYCGMDRVKFAHSRMMIDYEKADSVGTCSIRCLAVEYVNAIDKQPTAIHVGDFSSKSLIDAEKAFWVLVPGKMGVMTQRAKWAFADKAAAEAYVSKNGGEIVDFEVAMKAASLDLFTDTQMIRKKRKMKRMKSMKMKHN